MLSFPTLYNLSKRELYEKVIRDVMEGNAGTIHPDVYKAYSDNLRKAVGGVFRSDDYGDRYFDLQAQLQSNVTRFAAYKAYHLTEQLKKQREKWTDDDEYKKVAKAVLNTFNRYQAAEYNTATARARTAKQWTDFTSDPIANELYPNLKWLPSRSANPREEHQVFYGLVLPKTDLFWQQNQPGNLWNCKCDWEETDAPATNERPATVCAKGLEGNPAETGEIFTKECTYFKYAGKEGKETIESFLRVTDGGKYALEKEKPAEEESDKKANSPFGKDKIKKDTDLTKAIDNLKSGWFEQGFKEIKTEKNKHNNGSTDAKGTIWLRPQIKKNCISGFEKIRTGKECTEDEERSIATLWHEITHNRHDLKKDSVTPGLLSLKETRYMETANEFVARKTLPELYQKIGGSMKYPRFMSDRDNTGYNNWVVKYQKAIADNNLDEAKVLKTVKKGLFEGDYRQQKQNLINGLVEGGKKVDANGTETYSFSKTDAQKIVDNLF